MAATLNDVLSALNKLIEINSSSALILPNPGEDWGTASAGSQTTLIDNSKNWPENSWFSGRVIISIDGTYYRAVVSGNLYNQLSFSQLPVAVRPGSIYRIIDVSSQITAGTLRPGILPASNQRTYVFAYIAAGLPIAPCPYTVPYVRPQIPPIGTQTAVASATIMTNGVASFIPSSLVGGIIFNDTDGSYGIIIANGVTTITVSVLTGGTLNVFSLGDAYSIGMHLYDTFTGVPMPFILPKGITMSIVEIVDSGSQDHEVWVTIDRAILITPFILSAGRLNCFAPINKYSTITIDPSANLPHPIDVIIINRGLSAMRGGIEIVTLLEQPKGG